MSNIQRICPSCGASGPVSAQFCERCGQNFEHRASSGSTLPVRRSSLPAVASTAALPLLAGAASLALRAVWRLLQAHLREQNAQVAPRQGKAQTAITPASPQPPAPSGRRTIRIRSTWVVGGPDGVYRHGASDHTIEIDD